MVFGSVRSGQIKNIESARVSMIGQVKPVATSPLRQAQTSHDPLPSGTIAEEVEEDDSSSTGSDAAKVSSLLLL